MSAVTDLRDKLLSDLQANPLDVTNVVSQLRDATGAGHVLEPAKEQDHFSVWNSILVSLLNSGMVYQATEVGLAWYERLCELQADLGQRFHKGSPTHQLANCFLTRNRPHSAHWYFALAFIEDVFQQGGQVGTPIPETPATQALRLHFGRGSAYLTSLAERAREGDVDPHPERVLTQFARDRIYQGIRSDSSDEIPVNCTFLRALNHALDAGTSKEKGDALEFLASYLMSTLPGVRLVPNARAPDHELDLIVVQDVRDSYLVESLGRSFLVECKNWERAVSSRELNHFASKMRFHRCVGGVIFARNGVSGGQSPVSGVSAARLTQLRWYEQDSAAILVVDGVSLPSLEAEGASVSELLLKSYESVRFSLSP